MTIVRLKELRVDDKLYATTAEQIEAVKHRLRDDRILFGSIDCAYVRQDIACLVRSHEELRQSAAERDQLRAKVAELEAQAQSQESRITRLFDELGRWRALATKLGWSTATQSPDAVEQSIGALLNSESSLSERAYSAEVERDELRAVVERVREKAAAWRQEGGFTLNLLPNDRTERIEGYAEAQIDLADEVSAILPPKADQTTPPDDELSRLRAVVERVREFRSRLIDWEEGPTTAADCVYELDSILPPKAEQ